jgi:hypothetical protein
MVKLWDEATYQPAGRQAPLCKPEPQTQMSERCKGTDRQRRVITHLWPKHHTAARQARGT